MALLRIAQRYEIEDLLEAGGMGQVYLAMDTETNKQVAVKALKPDLTTPELIERFQREGEALSRLCFVLAITTLYLVSQGVAVVEQGKRRWVARYGGLMA